MSRDKRDIDSNNLTTTTVAAQPTNRRGVLRTLASGAAGLLGLAAFGTTSGNAKADNKDGNNGGNSNGNGGGEVNPSTTGQPLLIGQDNQPTHVNPTIQTTGLSNPSQTLLAPIMFNVTNSTNAQQSGAISDCRVGIAARVTGIDQQEGGYNAPKIGLFGEVDQAGGGLKSYGVYGKANGTGYGGLFEGVFAPLKLQPGSFQSAPPAADTTHQVGELYVSSNGSLYYCVGQARYAGQPTQMVWREVAGSKTASIHYLPAPDRFVDTRPGSQNRGGSQGLSGGNAPVFNILGVPGRDGRVIPKGAIGIVGNVTIVAPSHDGFIKVLPGSTNPNTGTSTVNFKAGVDTANAFNCALDPNGPNDLVVVVPASVNTCHMLIDVVAYYI